MYRTHEVEISDSSFVGEVRRQVQSLAQQHDFDELQAGKISIVVTELATNILKHAGAGHILFSVQSDVLHLVALDNGPGISQWDQASADGYSTTGTAGNGLGAVMRLSTCFDFYSGATVGTAIVAKFRRTESTNIPDMKFQVGAVNVPYAGEELSGDGWILKSKDNSITFGIADGLGHGALANVASNEAAAAVIEHSDLEPGVILSLAHKRLTATRGAAMAVLKADLSKNILLHAGVGNTTATIIQKDLTTKRLISYDGTVGMTARKIQQFAYPFPENALCILATDGIQTQWELKKYPGLFAKDPMLIASIIYRDFTRRRDDATVVVLKRVDHE